MTADMDSIGNITQFKTSLKPTFQYKILHEFDAKLNSLCVFFFIRWEWVLLHKLEIYKQVSLHARKHKKI